MSALINDDIDERSALLKCLSPTTTIVITKGTKYDPLYACEATQHHFELLEIANLWNEVERFSLVISNFLCRKMRLNVLFLLFIK